jgi:Sec-independent protein translocase protein TatA
MFDIGWSEIIVVAIVGCLALDVKDIFKILKWVKQVTRHFNVLTKEIKEFFVDLEQETKSIVDLDGNKQKTYDLDDIAPDLKKKEDGK